MEKRADQRSDTRPSLSHRSTTHSLTRSHFTQSLLFYCLGAVRLPPSLLLFLLLLLHVLLLGRGCTVTTDRVASERVSERTTLSRKTCPGISFLHRAVYFFFFFPWAGGRESRCSLAVLLAFQYRACTSIYVYTNMIGLLADQS